jgi:negative regulator of flagellin synthesis FlgM
VRGRGEEKGKKEKQHFLPVTLKFRQSLPYQTTSAPFFWSSIMNIESLGKPLAVAAAPEARLRPGSAPRVNTGESVQNVQLSPLATTLQKAEAALAQTPEVDQSRIEEIKQAIRGGQFKIDTSRIADGLIADVRQMLDSQAGRV